MTTCRCALLCISMPQSSLKAVKHAADTVMVLKSNCLRTNLQVCAALHRHTTKLPQGRQALGRSVMVLTNNCLRTNLQVCAALQQHATKLPQGCQALGNSKGVEKQLLAY